MTGLIEALSAFIQAKTLQDSPLGAIDKAKKAIDRRPSGVSGRSAGAAVRSG